MTIALDPNALLAKSKVYVRKALAAKGRSDFDEYQLWASLSIELLGKHTLAARHPSLIVDAGNPNNLLVAAGIPVQTAVKTIGGEEVFSRLRHLSRRFAGCFEFCKRMALRRNAELHSGEVPFSGMSLDVREGEYWHAAEAILECVDLQLDDWLGADSARTSKQIVQAAREAKMQAARERVRQAKETFDRLPLRERTLLIAQSRQLKPWTVKDRFRLVVDNYWLHLCPACEANAVVGGDKYQEHPSDAAHLEPGWEEVVVEYSGEELYCPTCSLHLEGHVSLAAAGVDPSHVETEERETEYEPEFGNC
jgi:hypothetical protein